MLPVKNIILIGNYSADLTATQYISSKYVYDLKIASADMAQVSALLRDAVPDLIIIYGQGTTECHHHYVTRLRQDSQVDQVPIIVCRTAIDVLFLDHIFSFLPASN
ncbi:hypothetical protein KTO58_05905 [Chitinophaga pendula]|uniref:hypothetical protein n=1 Tax=Chitinophaga TaxID=79328 RepID=UPI000BAF2029|nr:MULTISPECIES: hypothetical protein [Chitinophaga]ASZ13654.1 hypothetical protein CK934_23220 [Chitinophaga sp. MD30]UCJ08721.1 hypothetical protein KTO58_05905 [Chitinophaga pendula]